MNDFGRSNYGGPCPPSGTHRYCFKLFALDAVLDLKEGLRRKELEQLMPGHILEKAELVGLYRRDRYGCYQSLFNNTPAPRHAIKGREVRPGS